MRVMNVHYQIRAICQVHITLNQQGRKDVHYRKSFCARIVNTESSHTTHRQSADGIARTQLITIVEVSSAHWEIQERRFEPMKTIIIVAIMLILVVSALIVTLIANQYYLNITKKQRSDLEKIESEILDEMGLG